MTNSWWSRLRTLGGGSLLAWRTALVLLMAFVATCDDPLPPTPLGGLVLVIRTFPGAEKEMADIDHIVIETEHVEVRHDSQGSVTVDTGARTILLRNADGDRFVAQYQVPVGTFTEIRIFASAVTVFLKDGSSQALELRGPNLPSWNQTGWKIVPADGLSGFPIVENELTGVRALFDPDDRMNHNKPHGYKIKPTVQAELFDPNPARGAPGVLIDHITFVAARGVTTAQVEAMAALVGASIARVPYGSRWYRIKLPVSLDLEAGLLFFGTRPEALAVLPAVNLGQDQVTPNDLQPNNTLSGINLGWERAQNRADGFIGSHAVRVAVAEGPVDVTHPDLRLNIGIKQGELPKGIFDTRPPFDEITPDEIADHDCDPPGAPDGLITMRDLECDPSIAPPDHNDNGRLDAQDLARDTCSDGMCWADGVDDDDNSFTDESGEFFDFTDDLIGWNFIDKNNDVAPETPAQFDDHATFVAGIVGAEGDNGRDIAGVNWRVSVVNLRTDVLPASGAPDA